VPRWLTPTRAHSDRHLWWAVGLSLALHGLLLGTTFPRIKPEPEPLRALSVIIAPDTAHARPEKATRVAQADSDGGDRGRRATNARIAQAPEATPVTQAEQAVHTLERRVQELRRLSEQTPEPPPPQTAPESPATPTFNRAELLAQGSKLAKLETEIARDAETYQKRPRRKVFGATAVGVNYARYVEDWRTKVEAIGNLNYPQQARDKNLSGTLQLLVALRADGTVERIELRRSSGQPILDEAAQRIVELGAPYAPFPDALRKDTDILEVIRTWTFSRDQRLHAESQ